MAFVDVIAAAFVEGATVGAIAAGVAAVGTDMMVVGMVTGNKTLTEVGGAMSLAGGVVGFAAGAIGGTDAAVAAGTDAADSSAASSPALLGGSSNDAAAAMLNPSTAASQSAIVSSDVANGANAVNGATQIGSDPLQGALNGMGSNASGASNDLLNNLSTPSNIGANQTSIGAGQSGAGGTGGATGSGIGTGGTGQPSVAPDASSTWNAAKDSQAYNDLLPNGGVAAPSDSTFGSIKSWFDGLPEKTKTSVLQTAAQGVASMVGGLFNGWTQQQKLALAQQQQALAQTQYTNAMTNASAQPKVAGSYNPQAPAAPTGLLGTIKPSNV